MAGEVKKFAIERTVQREKLALILLHNYRSMWQAFKTMDPASPDRRYYGMYFAIVDNSLKEMESSPPERYKKQRKAMTGNINEWKLYRDILYYLYIDAQPRTVEQVIEVLNLPMAKSTFLHYRAVAIDMFSCIAWKHYLECTNAKRKE